VLSEIRENFSSVELQHKAPEVEIMFLVDTIVFLEILLKRDKKEDCKNLLKISCPTTNSFHYQWNRNSIEKL